MENWRRQNWDNQRGSYNYRPPRGNSQPTVPSWEKQFCKVVGSVDWGSILRMKRFVHLYDNVIAWDDSAVEETFHNEKKRFWAKIKGLPCDIPLPDPDMYIDKIDWDNIEIDHGLFNDLENNLVTSSMDENHEPVIIFGDAILPKETVTGWGDEEENFNKIPNNGEVNIPPPTGWGDDNPNDDYAPTGWGNSNEDWNNNNNNYEVVPGYEGPATGWGNWNNNNNYEVGPGYEGPATGWGNWNNNNNYEVGPAYEKPNWGPRNEGNGGRYGSRNRGSRFRGNEGYRPRNYEGRHKGPYGGDRFTSGPPVSHRGGAIANGRVWKE